MPFITEELWHGLGYKSIEEFIQNEKTLTRLELESALSAADIQIEAEAVQRIDRLKEFVTKVRALKAEYNLHTKKDIQLIFKAESKYDNELTEHGDKVLSLIGAKTITSTSSAPEGCPATICALGTAYLDLASSIDVDAEKTRITKEIEKLTKVIKSIEGKLNNSNFTDKAPQNVVDGARQQLIDNKAKLTEFESLLSTLS